MLCEKCGQKEATYYYKENVNGTVKAYHLCSDCASDMQKTGEIGSFFGEDPFGKMMSLFSGDDFFGSLLGSPQAMPERTKPKTCPLCGGTFQDMVGSGKAGCPSCYEAFADELAPSISRIHGNRIHGSRIHGGKAPARFQAENEKKQKIARLEADLKAAIQAEEYEKAAELRDSLKALRQA